MTNKIFKKISPAILLSLIFSFSAPIQKVSAESEKFYLAGLAVSDTQIAEQWYLEKIKAPDAWEKTQGSEKIVVAVIDTGMDSDHPDLIDNIWINSKEIPGNGIDDDNNGYVDDVHGWDFVDNDNVPEPNIKNKYSVLAVDHGTVVAGIIAAMGNNAFAGSGVAWQAKIMPLKVFNEQGESDVPLVAAAIQYAINKKADIINMSFVGFGNSPLLQEKIKAAYDAGILLVAAAGNESTSPEGSNLDITPSYPVCGDGQNGENWVLGVAALDKNDQRADFSNFGKKCVDISAPGVNIASTLFFNSQNQDFNKYFGGGFNGTSVATPQVVGAAVLLKALHPNYKNKQLMDTLISSTDNIDGANSYYLGSLGSGRLNILKALNTPAISMETEEEESVKYVVSAKGSGEPKILLLGSKGEKIKDFFAFSSGSKIGTNIALGDVDNDGMIEIVVGAGAGGGPHVRIFNLSGELENQFFAFGEKRRNGVLVAVGDADGDGKNEIITVEAGNVKPVARIFNNQGELIKDNIGIFSNIIKNAVGLAMGDVNKDGKDEMIVSTPSGIAGKIKVIDSSGNILGEFYPFGKNFYGGINVTVSDLSGSGWPEIIAGKASGGDAAIKTFDYTGRLLAPDFLAYEKYKYGINVSSGDRDGDGYNEIVAATNGGRGAEVKILDNNFNLKISFFPFGKIFTKGINAYIVTRK